MPSEMTPEEKLLALIQQDRRASAPSTQATAPAASGKPAEPAPAVPDTSAPSSAATVSSQSGANAAVSASKGIVAAAAENSVQAIAKQPPVTAVVADPPSQKIVPPPQPERPSTAPRESTPVADLEASPSAAAAVQRREKVPKEVQPDEQTRKLRLAAATASAESSRRTEVSAAPVAVVPEPAEPSTIGAATVPSEYESSPVVVGPSWTGRPASGRAGLTALGVLNRTLGLVVLVLLIVVVYSAASVRSDVANRVREQMDGAGDLQPPSDTVEMAPAPPVEQFLARIATRSLFVSPVVVTNEIKPDLAAAVKDLKLMGISLDPKTPAESMVIIRNKALSQTYFIKPGQVVGETGLVLDRILSDRAVLKQKKQEIELR